MTFQVENSTPQKTPTPEIPPFWKRGPKVAD